MNARLAQARLYAIVDLGYVSPDRVAFVTDELVAGGVDLIQLRAKNAPVNEVAALANQMRSLIPPNGPLFIINDHPAIATNVAVDGVHLGQDDLDLAAARALINRPGLIVGKSTHSREQAIAAVKEGADYIGVGPIFPTATKPDYTPVGLELISQVAAEVSLPHFCIGGIKKENLPAVLAAGARRVVIVSGILQSPSIPAYCLAVRELLSAYPLT